jgi:hypothetical protein
MGIKKYREFIKSRVIYRQSLCYHDRVLNEFRVTCNIRMILDPRKILEKNFKQENCQLMLEPTE